MNDDPLARLLIESTEIDRARLARALNGIVAVDTETGQVILLPDFFRLNAIQKVVAYLLGSKVSVLLGKRESDAVRTVDIAAETNMPIGTVAPKLKELREKRLVSQTPSSEYHVGDAQLVRCLQLLDKGGD
jgi:hypothetical protein